MLCITGLPLIFIHEIDHALGNSAEAPELAEASGRVNVETILADALSRRPGNVVQFLVADAEEPDLWFVRLGTTPESSDISAFYAYDARTGEFLNDYPLQGGFTNLMLRLHTDMYAGLPGTLFLGFMGVLLAVSLISGTVLYGPFMRKLPFGTVRRQRSTQLKWLDLHNLLGIATLVWLLVVGITGVVNTLSIPIFDHWQQTQLTEMTEPYRNKPPLDGHGSPDRALAGARAAAPDMTMSFMAFPGNDFSDPRHYMAFMQGTSPWTSTLLTPLLIDANTGEVIERASMPWYVTTLLVSQPLHFGDYGGMPLKILWAVLDIIAIIVLISGVYLWVKARNVTFEEWLSRTGKEYIDTADMGSEPGYSKAT